MSYSLSERTVEEVRSPGPKGQLLEWSFASRREDQKTLASLHLVTDASSAPAIARAPGTALGTAPGHSRVLLGVQQ